MQAAVKHMKEGERIINIGSTNAERIALDGGVYAMSKSALQGLVQGLARELWVISEIVKATLVESDRLKYPAKPSIAKSARFFLNTIHISLTDRATFRCTPQFAGMILAQSIETVPCCHSEQTQSSL